MTAPTATHAYVGRGKCGHVIMLAVDDGSSSNATSVARVIRNGGTVERLTIEAARAVELCTCRKSAREALR